MKKANALWLILDLIFLVIFNTLFFVLGGIVPNASVWISFAFIHFAYLMLLVTPKLIRKGKSTSVFGFSLYSISAVYFLIEFIIGILFIMGGFYKVSVSGKSAFDFIEKLALWTFFPKPSITKITEFCKILMGFSENYKIVLLVQLCLAGLYGIMLISNLIANEHTAAAEEKRQYEIAFVKNASAKLKGLLEKINDKEAKKKVEKVYDTIYSSPVKSHVDLLQIEERILASINELEDAVSTNNKENIVSLSNTMLSAVNERNMRLRNLN